MESYCGAAPCCFIFRVSAIQLAALHSCRSAVDRCGDVGCHAEAGIAEYAPYIGGQKYIQYEETRLIGREPEPFK